jgi:hypothetical protein
VTANRRYASLIAAHRRSKQPIGDGPCVVRNRREPRNRLQEMFERPIFCFAQAIAFDRKESSCLTIAFDGTDSGSASAQSLS